MVSFLGVVIAVSITAAYLTVAHFWLKAINQDDDK